MHEKVKLQFKSNYSKTYNELFTKADGLYKKTTIQLLVQTK